MGSLGRTLRSLSKSVLKQKVLREMVGRCLRGGFTSCPERYLFFSGGAAWSRNAGFFLGPILLPRLPHFTLASSSYLSSPDWLALRPAPPQLLGFSLHTITGCDLRREEVGEDCCADSREGGGLLALPTPALLCSVGQPLQLLFP